MLYQTLHGIPLVFSFEWPVHPSHSGSDWFVLHGNAVVDDGSALHAEVAINLSRAIVNVLPSLEPKDVKPIAINAVRKVADTRDLEFIKSGKRQPVNASSRIYSLVRNQWTFNDVNDADLRDFIERKVYWDCVHGGGAKSWIADPVEALYLNSQPERLMQAARALATDGIITIDAELAQPTAQLESRAAEFQQRSQAALAELEAKHAYERA